MIPSGGLSTIANAKYIGKKEPVQIVLNNVLY